MEGKTSKRKLEKNSEEERERGRVFTWQGTTAAAAAAAAVVAAATAESESVGSRGLWPCRPLGRSCTSTTGRSNHGSGGRTLQRRCSPPTCCDLRRHTNTRKCQMVQVSTFVTMLRRNRGTLLQCHRAGVSFTSILVLFLVVLCIVIIVGTSVCSLIVLRVTLSVESQVSKHKRNVADGFICKHQHI